jgi:hypothetical protein
MNSENSTTVRFLNGDLITYPDTSYDNPEELIEAICETYPTPIHPLQVELYRDDVKEKENHINALIFPKKRIVVGELDHIFKNVIVRGSDYEDLDLDKMTNESVIRYILSLPISDIPNRIFTNPSDIVVDFLHSSGIFRLDQTPEEINEWFRLNIDLERGFHIFSNPSDRIVDLLVNIDVDSLFEKYQTWVHVRNTSNTSNILSLFSVMASTIANHSLVTE